MFLFNDSLSTSKLHRITALVYLLVVPLGVFSILFVPSKLFVSGDASATAANIREFEFLFRMGIISDIIASILMVLLVFLLQRMFSEVNSHSARLMVIFVIIGAIIALVGQVFQFGVLFLLSAPEYLSTFSADQLESLSFLFLRLHARIGTIAFIFWGAWLFPLGWLIWKSGFLPSWLGAVVAVAGAGYVIDSFFLFAGYNSNIGMYTGWGELVFIALLLFKKTAGKSVESAE